MSINQLVNQSHKEWLDTNIGGVTVDGFLTYDSANMNMNDSLVLNASKVAKWTPITNLTLGSVFIGLLGTTTLSSAVTQFNISSFAPHPTVYTLLDGNKVQVNENGTYFVSTVLFSTDTTADFAVEITKNGTAFLGTRDVAGPSPILGYNKMSCSSFVLCNLVSGDFISIIANSVSGSAVTTRSSGSYMLVSKIN